MIKNKHKFALSTTDMAHGGSALGRHEGKVIFVPYALPGEEVVVKITEDKRRYAHARVLDVRTPSPDRVTPPCPYFGECGGCQWQHAAYEAQLAYKGSVVRDQLVRLGRFEDPPVRETLASPDPWHYRNHAQFSIDGRGRLGFQAASSHRIVPVEECLLLHPLLDELFFSLELGTDDELPPLRGISLRAGVNTGDQMIVFEPAGERVPALEVDFAVSCVLLQKDGPPINLIGNNFITERVAGRTFRVSARSFFQVNTPQAETLVRCVTDYLDLTGHDSVLDLYSGVGLFALSLADRAEHVVGIEGNSGAAADFVFNAEEMEADNVTILAGPVEEVLADLEMPVDAAVMDPPRTGVDQEALAALARLAPERIVYVSCDPATLARDGRALAEAGYALEVIQPVDMFPQTYHVETVSLWMKS
jgi:23S rRNA (uracil1939-C5)-methyltransferase